MQTGIVKKFFEEKGFGFITPSNGGKDVFVHHSGIVKNGVRRVSLTAGQEVTFDVIQGNKGPNAVNVQPTSRVRRG